MSEIDPLVQRVDALLRRHQTDAPEERAPVPGGEEDIPVLTEIVDPTEAVALHPQAGELRSAQLAAQLEHAVLQRLLAELDRRLLAELDRTLDRHLGRSLGDLFEQMQHSLRAELAVRMREMVREAVAAAVTRELATHAAPGKPGAEERSA